MSWTREITWKSPVAKSPTSEDTRRILIIYDEGRGGSATGKVRVLRQHFPQGQFPPEWEAREAEYLRVEDPRMYLSESDHKWLEFR